MDLCKLFSKCTQIPFNGAYSNSNGPEKLDTFTDQYIKHWAGVPKCTTNSLLHTKAGLDISSITELFKEAHMISHARKRPKGDTKVNHVMDCTVDRENNFTRKKSITVVSEKTFQSAMNMNAVGEERLNFKTGWERQEKQFNSDITEQVKLSLN